MNALVTYLKNVRSELAHVVWPSRKQAIAHVAVIVFISVVAIALVAGLDYVFTLGVKALILK